jgi:hypothetical protein
MGEIGSFEWAGMSVATLNPTVIAEELGRIRRRRGALTPEIVVDAAKSAKSPLHGFIFDGTTPEEALDRYRLERAVWLLRNIVIVEGASEEIRVRAFVLDRSRHDWVTAQEAVANPELVASVRRELLAKLRSIRRQASAWDEFAGVVAAIDEVLEEAG